MTKIDFHILPTYREQQTLEYVVRLVQKARSRKHQVLISTESDDQSKALSYALWNFKPESFIPHTSVVKNHYPLQISQNQACGQHHDILINLCREIPEYFSRFERIFEVVSQQPELLKSSRDRYRYYNDRGYELNRHDLRDRA